MMRKSPSLESALDKAAKAAARKGYSAFRRCPCGNTLHFTYDTDSMTGSSYAKCMHCQSIIPFQGAWRDNALGMNFGSWWSQQLADGFVVEP